MRPCFTIPTIAVLLLCVAAPALAQQPGSNRPPIIAPKGGNAPPVTPPRGGNAPGDWNPADSVPMDAPANAPLPKDQEDAFTRQDKLAPQVHDRAQAMVAELAAELAGLRATIKAELVGKRFLSQSLAGAALKPYSDVCPAAAEAWNCQQCQQLSAADFDKWFDVWVENADGVKTMLDNSLANWNQERTRTKQILKHYATYGLGTHRADYEWTIKDWLQHETEFYHTNYWWVAWEANLLWELYVQALTNLSIPVGAQQFSVQKAPDFGYPANFGGQLRLMSETTTIETLPQLRSAAEAACKMANAWDKFRKAIDQTGGQATAETNAADHALQAAAQSYEDALLACRQAEEAQRDSVAPQIRPIRDHLVETRSRLRQRLARWRTEMIKDHLYAGEGDAAIAVIYGDGHELHLDGKWFNDWLSGGTILGTGVDDQCYRYAPGIGTGVADNAQEAIKYPDIETKPFAFKIDLSEARKLAGNASGADPSETP